MLADVFPKINIFFYEIRSSLGPFKYKEKQKPKNEINIYLRQNFKITSHFDQSRLLYLDNKSFIQIESSQGSKCNQQIKFRSNPKKRMQSHFTLLIWNIKFAPNNSLPQTRNITSSKNWAGSSQ